MSRRLRVRIALGLLAFVASATLRPTIAAAAAAADAPGDDGRGAPAPSTGSTVTPIAGNPGNAAPPPRYAAPPYGQGPPPGYAPYPGYPPSTGYLPVQLVTVHRARRGLVTGGAVTFGVSWGIASTISLLCNGNNCNSSADYLWIPIAGPLIAGFRDSGSSDPAVFVLWSVAEAAGAAMLIVGVLGHDVMEYRVAQRGPTVRLAPMLARDTGGMALTARW